MHRGEYAKRHGLLRFELFRKIKKILCLTKRNCGFSPLGERLEFVSELKRTYKFKRGGKFFSEFYKLRNFREGFNLKRSSRNSNSDRRLYFLKNINYNSDMLHHDKNNKGRLGILAQHEAGKISCNKLFQHKTELKRIEPLARISNAHYHSQRTAPSPRWGEGIDFVIINNFSETVFSRFTSHFSRKRTAFTLAEVLITLGIIGIVAAITLPTIINNYRIKVLENQFKKADSIIQQAVQKTANECGVASLSELIVNCTTHMCDNNENYRLLKQQIPEINEIWYQQFKTVKFFSDSEAYWKNIYCNSFFGAKHNNTTYSCLYSGPPYKYMILADGMTVSPLFAYLGGFSHPVLIMAVFDTNGPYKGPNRIGYDIFRYETMNYNTMCNPNIVNSENFKGCYYWAHRNVSPLDSSKSYWSVLYKPLSYWKE